MISKGNTGVVMLLPGGDGVIKAPVPWYSNYLKRFQREQLRREIAVYRHLPQGHRRLIRMLGYNEGSAVDDSKGRKGTSEHGQRKDGNDKAGNGHVEDDVSVTLEYMPNHSLRSYLMGGAKFPAPDDEQRARGAAIPRRRRACWALEATDGIVLLHAHDVIHADIRPDNMLLDDGLHVRLIDFSGCSLRGTPALSYESASFYMPRTPENSNGKVGCSVTTDLFALGSSYYQIVTCFAPWHGLSHDEVEARYNRGEFPPLVEDDPPPDGESKSTSGSMLFADTIWRCWHGEFATAADVLNSLKAEIRAAFSPEDLAFIEQESGISLSE
ncbi:Protein kinase-like domain protein [Niveomyces insectorum RCEF 264]|uniref:EKC/KEOPS complex subunit BUD32 n=1 Tax=Niveomyces insectorum RCEF 264 TaxID=1081102 RepID=A0A167VK29_9HYPO|nr:Protein kinase-like domain protein [Niveomyces insectorum RCEF 264]